jgi:2-succinyl-6-hydroxy-2,4-cyclohexadiene-1-carboxylate synthase
MATVTFLHGFTQSGESWAELISLLPPGHELLTPDLRGHGRNPAPAAEPHTLAAGCADVVRLWDQRGVERSHLVGYSLGGRLALHLAARHPQRVLTLTVISGHAGLDEAARPARLREDQALAAKIEANGVEWFAAYWALRPLFAGLARRGPAFLEALDERRRHNRADGLAASLRGMGAGATEPFWVALGAIDAPTLLIAGAEDESYLKAGRRLAGSIKGARLEAVPGAGHVVHLEQPDAVARLLGAHLSSR